MIILFLEKQRILSKRYVFFSLWVETGVETLHLQLTLEDFRRGGTVASLSYLVALNGEFRSAMSCSKTTVFIYSWWWQSCHRPAGQGHGLLTVIPSSRNVTSQQSMGNGDHLWTPSLFSGPSVGSSKKYHTPTPPGLCTTYWSMVGCEKKGPGTYIGNCLFGSSQDLILQGCPMAMVPGADCRKVLSEAWRYLPQHLNSCECSLNIREVQFLHKTLKKTQCHDKSWVL